MNVSAAAKRKQRASFEDYFRPRVFIMLLLGFSSGLPFFLVGNTLGYWLRDEGTSLTAIGFLAWVGMAYSLKPFWAPIIDRVDAPIFGRLGRRRGWIMLTQILVCLGLAAMSLIGPRGGLVALGALALLVAFSSSTQDIVIDAWRIEAADNPDEIGLLSSAYQLGYRIAVLITDSLILISAQHLGWAPSYGIMALLMLIGIAATVKATEPKRYELPLAMLPLWTARGFRDAVVGPFLVFFRTFGWMALLMLAVISLYQVPNYVMGPMANPFYHDLGLSKDLVGSVRASVGFVATLLGIAAGGFSAARFGYIQTLVAGIVFLSLGTASYALLATNGTGIGLFSAVMMIDNFGISFSGVALTTYMSSLTSVGYTATQYALLSSAYSYIGKILKGPSGVVVDYLSHHGHTLLGAYAIFFLGSGAIGLPALLLCLILARVQPVRVTPATA